MSTVRVFVNGRGHDAPSAGTALDAVAVHSASDAEQVRTGALLVTDSRGIAIAAESPLFNGAVFRLVPNRERDASDPASQFDA
jgi:hypothetical protein